MSIDAKPSELLLKMLNNSLKKCKEDNYVETKMNVKYKNEHKENTILIKYQLPWPYEVCYCENECDHVQNDSDYEYNNEHICYCEYECDHVKYDSDYEYNNDHIEASSELDEMTKKLASLINSAFNESKSNNQYKNN